MLYWKKLRLGHDTIPYNWGFSTQVSNTQTWQPFFSKANQYADYTTVAQSNAFWGSNLADNNLPQATFCDRLDYSNQFGLSYGNYWAVDYDPATNSYNVVGDQIGRGLYQRYYKAMMDNMMIHPKKRIAYIDLKITDITNLNFRQLIYIDGVYYRLLKVSGYKPHLNDPTKVELQQWAPEKGGSLATEGVWINTNSTGGGGYNDDGSSTDEEPDNNL
ncbi:MAG TPA: hypothetical protein EYO58_09120 [Flavobacteriales bacterium]|nr:hypothetical protein [Flavobacteriales bacterium]